MPGWWGGGGVPPWTCPRGMSRGYTTPRPTTGMARGVLRAPRTPRNGPLGSGGLAGPGEAGEAGKAGFPLLYLRPFSPGTQNGPKAVLANGWIGSRSGRPQAGLDVQDLVGLSTRCASPGLGRGGATSSARSDASSLLAAARRS